MGARRPIWQQPKTQEHGSRRDAGKKGRQRLDTWEQSSQGFGLSSEHVSLEMITQAAVLKILPREGGHIT